MAKFTKEQIVGFLETQEAKDVKTILAYMLDKTESDVDNQIVVDVSEYADILGEELQSVEEMNPEAKEAIEAAIRLAKIIAEKTETKWDDVLIGMIDKITGATKSLEK